MTALVKMARGPGNITLQEVPVPHAGPGEVRVAVAATGICGTDLHIDDDEFATTPPVIMGHEVSGFIDEIGSGVEACWQGRRVALETYARTCGACEYCRSGRTNLCSGRRSIGSHVDGGFATYVVVPIRNADCVDDAVSLLAGPLYEPLACATQALCDPPVASPGDGALVVGPGPMGLLAAQILRTQGATVAVVGTAQDTVRLSAATALHFVAVTSEALESVEPEGGFQVVAECSGTEPGAATALRSARKAGRFVQIGLAGHPVTLDLDLVCFKELQVTSGNASTPASWARAERMVASRSVALDGMVSASLPIAAWQDAFARTRARDCVKIVLQPEVRS